MTPRILVVEDNAANLDLITYLLRSFGYTVACESSGEAGLQNALAQSYDLVLSDILMPDMDGFEFARRFKADPRARKTPLVAVTALAMTGDREKVLSSGFDGYISKPIDPQRFAAQISSFLNRHG